MEEGKEQDRLLPTANISRIMKQALSQGPGVETPGKTDEISKAEAKISREAKEIVQECVSEFISFITSEASDKCKEEKRKTINGDDIICAMQTLGFDRYLPALQIYLKKFREAQKIAGQEIPSANEEEEEDEEINLGKDTGSN
jgi:nuclear transcription Y subunit beta